MRLLLVCFLVGCGSANITVNNDGGYLEDAQTLDVKMGDVQAVDVIPPATCYSGGHLYTETFTVQFGSTCNNGNDLPPITVQVNMDGSIGLDNHCTTVLSGCETTSTGCYTNARGVYCSIYNQITYTKDGSSGSGVMEMVCYPMICNPDNVCFPMPTSQYRCVGTYGVSLVRQN